MSDTRYWLLVLLIPLVGVPLLLGGMGSIEIVAWLALMTAWVVAFVKHDRIEPRVPLIAFGVVVALAAGVAVYNYATLDGSYVSVEQDQAAN